MDLMCRKGIKYGALICLLLVVAVTAAFGFDFPGFSKFEKVTPVNGVVTIPVGTVSDGKAHYFRIVEGGKEINFFIVKGGDGVIHTAFDACDVCYREKKGYVQQGQQMICKNCNQKFAIARIGGATGGGCNPSHLPAKVDAATLKISIADIKAGARLF
jgi:uncharacterized membrane protein